MNTRNALTKQEYINRKDTPKASKIICKKIVKPRQNQMNPNNGNVYLQW